MTVNDPFSVWEHDAPSSPVILSVPHAGRTYPPRFSTLSRLSPQQALPLEDRFADLLIDAALKTGVQAIAQRTARVWIDLNRDEREYDPALVPEARCGAMPPTAKVRGGLGLVPRRLAGPGEIWRAPIALADFTSRVEQHYRPYHARLAAMVSRVQEAFGVAVLIDLHSMPPLPPALHDGIPPRFVIGDLFGRAAAGRYTSAAFDVLLRSGQRVSLNSPYSGGHVLARHTRPSAGVHGLQVEVDRSLYLDELGQEPGAGLAGVQALVARLASALRDEAMAAPIQQAAE